MSVSIESLSPNDKINFTTRSNIYGRTTWNSCTFQGHVGFDVARNVADLASIVAATAAYFPDGSPTSPEQINYVMVRSEVVSGLVVIPAPLIDKSTLDLVSNEIHTVTVRDSVSAERLRSMLAGNGLTNFTINTSRNGA